MDDCLKMCKFWQDRIYAINSCKSTTKLLEIDESRVYTLSITWFLKGLQLSESTRSYVEPSRHAITKKLMFLPFYIMPLITQEIEKQFWGGGGRALRVKGNQKEKGSKKRKREAKRRARVKIPFFGGGRGANFIPFDS